MIVSAIWLPARSNRVNDLEIDVANLEPVPLTFRFGYTIVQAHGSGSQANATVLNEGVKLLAAFGFNPKDAVWTRNDRTYRTGIDIEFRAGEVRAHGLRAAGDFPGAPDTRSLLYHPPQVLRGWWELSLPALPNPSGTPKWKAQLDHPARVLVTVIQRVFKSATDPESFLALPLASGKAEHLIPPDPPPSELSGRIASKRRAARRPRP